VSASSPTKDDEPQVTEALSAQAASNGLAPQGSVRVWWRPTATLVLVWIVGGVALAMPGVALFASIHAAANGGASSFTLRISDLPIAGTTFSIVVVLLFAAHELVHGLILLGYGIRARFGVQLTARVLPALYTTAPGEQFTRLQFLTIALAPLIVVSLIGALLVLMPFGGSLVLPLATHLGGCIGDLWLAALVLRQPRGTRVEDQRNGVIFVRPFQVPETGMRSC
jgi:Putative zincin peptidase